MQVSCQANAERKLIFLHSRDLYSQLSILQMVLLTSLLYSKVSNSCFLYVLNVFLYGFKNTWSLIYRMYCVLYCCLHLTHVYERKVSYMDSIYMISSLYGRYSFNRRQVCYMDDMRQWMKQQKASFFSFPFLSFICYLVTWKLQFTCLYNSCKKCTK